MTGEGFIFDGWRRWKEIAGYPLELSQDAPKDKVVMHPEVAAQIELAMMKFACTVVIEKTVVVEKEKEVTP